MTPLTAPVPETPVVVWAAAAAWAAAVAARNATRWASSRGALVWSVPGTQGTPRSSEIQPRDWPPLARTVSTARASVILIVPFDPDTGRPSGPARTPTGQLVDERGAELLACSADLTPVGWLGPGQVAVILRSAYDPAVAATLERHGKLGQDLATAGPVAVTETWGSLRTDSAWHTVLWVAEWPRSMVYPGFLAPVLLSTGIQRSVSLLYTPMRSDQAARDIRKKKVEHLSDAAQRARMGQIEDAAQTAEYHDVLQQEADLTAGHGVLRVSGLISITAPTLDDLEAAIAAIEQSAIQASCETRRLVGQQAAAFTAAALPLCRTV